MKKLFVTMMVLVTVILTGCSSKPPVPEYPAPTAQSYQQPQVIYREVIREVPVQPTVIQHVPVYIQVPANQRPMYAPNNVYTPVPGMPARVQPAPQYYQQQYYYQ